MSWKVKDGSSIVNPTAGLVGSPATNKKYPTQTVEGILLQSYLQFLNKVQFLLSLLK
ncbi:hypothetical protein AB1K18_10205 [Peribacillus simplex]|uniref:hypothetical protein n=1 Tax=Peribacillus simplex TaxID=1478 RepID=UPI003B8DBFCE